MKSKKKEVLAEDNVRRRRIRVNGEQGRERDGAMGTRAGGFVVCGWSNRDRRK